MAAVCTIRRPERCASPYADAVTSGDSDGTAPAPREVTEQVLLTARLRLVPITLDLADQVIAGRLDGVRGFPAEGEHLIATMVRESGVDADPTWGSRLIQLRENDFFVGGIGLKGPPDGNGDVEIGYGLAEGGWGRGYVTEAVTAILERCRAHPEVHRVLAYTDPANVASHRVLVRTGFALIDKSEPEWCWALHVGG